MHVFDVAAFMHIYLMMLSHLMFKEVFMPDLGLRHLLGPRCSGTVSYLTAVGRSVDGSVGRSVGQSVGRSVGQLVGQSVGRSVGRSVSQSVSRSVGWSVSQSFSWLVG